MRWLVVYRLFNIGGAAGLIYQIAWMRWFRLVLGSTAMAASAVIAAFFLGMSLAIPSAPTSRDVVRRYATAEILVGIFSLTVAFWLA